MKDRVPEKLPDNLEGEIMERLEVLIGDFVVWQDRKYRTTSYQKEHELFEVEDVEKKKYLITIQHMLPVSIRGCVIHQ